MMLPKLPGYVPAPDFARESYKRRSFACQDRAQDQQQLPLYQQAVEELCRQDVSPTQDKNAWKSTTHTFFGNPCDDGFDPAVSEQRQLLLNAFKEAVLTFDACFFEKIAFNNQESERIRRVVLQCYVVDNTISIQEPRQRNAGMQQGTLLRRQSVKSAADTPITPADLRVGQTLEMLGTQYLFYGCDRFTREFYRKVGAEQPEDFEVERDIFEREVIDAFHARKNFGINSSVHNGRVPSHQQYFENDKKVLRFYATCGPELFLLSYFLADDNIELRELRRDPGKQETGTLLLKRQKVPKRLGAGLPGIPETTEFFALADLRPGETLNILSRELLLGECDPPTQIYMREQCGLEFAVRVPPVDPAALCVAPGKATSNQPDFFAVMDESGELRFWAKMISSKAEDASRRFIITFYLGTRALMIYEKQLRNTGFDGGKFLEKRVYNGANGEPIEPVDLLVGKPVEINKHLFRVLSSDRQTAAWVRSTFGVEMTPLE